MQVNEATVRRIARLARIKITDEEAKGLQKELSQFTIEQHDDGAWKVFYVVAPDGLCYWFGERQSEI